MTTKKDELSFNTTFMSGATTHHGNLSSAISGINDQIALVDTKANPQAYLGVSNININFQFNYI